MGYIDDKSGQWEVKEHYSTSISGIDKLSSEQLIALSQTTSDKYTAYEITKLISIKPIGGNDKSRSFWIESMTQDCRGKSAGAISLACQHYRKYIENKFLDYGELYNLICLCDEKIRKAAYNIE